MIIREMTNLDIQQIREIAFDTWRDTYSSFIPTEIQNQVLADAYSDEEMNHRFNNSLNLVFESNGAILGYAFFSGDLFNPDIYLESLYIHPDHQGKGIGKQLMQAGVAKYRNPKAITLVVYKGNTSISFYEKVGFSVIKENNGDFFGHPVVFIVMKKELEG
jgi:ribosomal protein S18 acetylase RimI-like enzyme